MDYLERLFRGLFFLISSFFFFVGQNLIIYFISAEITEFQADKTLQGLTHSNGRLRVQECGSYYIYAQVFFEIYTKAVPYHNRVALSVNGAPFSLMQTGLGGRADYGSLYTGGIVHLQKGDYISLVTVYDSYLWVSRAHSFFGAYKISQ